MRFLTSSLALFLSILLVEASAIVDVSALASRHHHISARVTSLEVRQKAKICPNRVNKHAAALKKANQNKPTTNNLAPLKNVTTPAAPPPPPKKTSNSNNGGGGSGPSGGVIRIKNSSCGDPRASRTPSQYAGPNGHMDWLTCGFESPGGWQPPHVTMNDIVTQPLSTALQSPVSPFKNCAPFIHLFERYGKQFGIAPIMLASFAMQESYCQPNTIGGGGEQGLMQITREKCVGAPGGNCLDPDFNIRTAARYFATTLAEVGGNVLLAAGRYNGWRRGLTKDQAFAARNSDCCRCQNNGDYPHQLFNGWLQNINAYNVKPRMGKYFNLDACD
ncbi:glycoside hydrolase family 23 protein [Panaeolus papilionaceus]|nr:glycoside hydrolase family 23 protein [Panaeolus papilionaceus]